VSTCCGDQIYHPDLNPRSKLGEEFAKGSEACAPSGWSTLGVFDHVLDSGGEILDAGAWNDDRVAAAMRFLCDAEKLPAIILAKLHMEMLPLDLQLPRLDEIVHF
jgi:hypothetical protein